MNRARVTPLIGLICSALSLLASGMSAEAKETAPSTRSNEFTFSLLPKSFQKNPVLDMTATTEVSDYGRLLRPATPQAPVYYITQPGGFKQMGSTMGSEHPPLPQELELAMRKALAVNGYLPAEGSGHAPALVVIYTWGSHHRLDPEEARMFPELNAKQQLERAMLVGGKKFRAEKAFAMENGEFAHFLSTEEEYLNYQAADSLYFVIASAYDYVPLTHGQRKLAWRTNMTVNAAGVNLQQTLIPLIVNAAPVLGRETTAPQIIQRRAKEGLVEVGIPVVVPDKAAPSPAKKP